jgi:hypothetical protein
LSVVREPELVAQIEFTEWTPDGHLRHSRFVGREKIKRPRTVRESTRGNLDGFQASRSKLFLSLLKQPDLLVLSLIFEK